MKHSPDNYHMYAGAGVLSNIALGECKVFQAGARLLK
jgi:hypothetical protein